MSDQKFPMKVKRGNSVVTIGQYENAGYVQFKVSYYFKGQRKQHTFADFKEARKRADEINDSVNNGDAETLLLTATERLEYTQAKEILKPLGISLALAVMNFADAQKLLGDVPLIRAAQDYVKRNPPDLQHKSVKEVVEEFLKMKKDRGVSLAHLQEVTRRLRGRLGLRKCTTPDKSFCGMFQCLLSSIGSQEIAKFLDCRQLGPMSYNQFLATLREFFNFAKMRKYLPQDWSELNVIQARKIPDSEPTYYSPSEVALLLSSVAGPMRAVLAICAFAGLRLAEVLRLDWEQVGVEDGKYIEVKGRTAKTRQRRLVPITDNLKAWLAPHIKSSGKVWPRGESLFRQNRCKAARRIVGFQFKNNALRHSYISYRMAQTSDEKLVSAEAGNSPEMVYQHYKALVTSKKAGEWFAVMPGDSSEKIIHLKTAVA